MKIYNLLALIFVAFCCTGKVDGADRFVARDVTSNMPFPVRRGNVSVIEFQSGSLPPNGVMYYAPNKEHSVGGLPLVLTESVAGISRFVQSEFPDGITQEFVRGVLPDLLSSNFSFVGGVSYRSQAKVIDVREAMKWAKNIFDAEEFNFLNGLVTVPVVIENGRHWSIKFTMWNSDGSVGIRFYSGQFLPFNIDTRLDCSLTSFDIVDDLKAAKQNGEIRNMMRRAKDFDEAFGKMQAITKY